MGRLETVDLVEEPGRRSGVVIRDLTTHNRTLTSANCGTFPSHCRSNTPRQTACASFCPISNWTTNRGGNEVRCIG